MADRLESDLAQLVELDAIRKRTAELRDEGYKALLSLGDGHANLGSQVVRLGKDRNDMEDFLLAKTLATAATYSTKREVVQEILTRRLRQYADVNLQQEWNTRENKAHLPVFKAARLLQALLVTPEYALSRGMFHCLYIITRELYSSAPPDWAMGAARAGEGGACSSFVTDACVRAIVRLAHRLQAIATLLERSEELANSAKRLREEVRFPNKWRDIEARRLICRLASIQPVPHDDVLLKLPQTLAIADTGNNLSCVQRYASDLRKIVRAASSRASRSAGYAIREIVARRRNEAKDVDFIRSETGHLVALKLLGDCQLAGDRVGDLVGSKQAVVAELAKLLRKLAQTLYDLLRPARVYSATVLDRELSAEQLRLVWDPAELVFAAVSFGWTERKWVDERLERAAAVLGERIDERGRFTAGAPFFSDDEGYIVAPVGAEALRGFAELLRRVERSEITESVAKRILAYFERLRVEVVAEDGDVACGWTHEWPVLPGRPSLWVTCVAVESLSRVNQMLDEKINKMVLRHFSSVRSRLASGLGLDDLFYPDYGLANAPEKIKRDSVAETLERLAAHVRRSTLPGIDPLHSVILHGPPGTGKTTLVKALAVSAGAPLVVVTPSDLVVTGSEGLEQRSRDVMRALSLLTRAVILFDEFEPVLLRRGRQIVTPSVFTFLTPGMLPKLKDLNESAKRRRVALVMVTNLIGVLDEAAIRGGRFDVKIGIYPPCPLSRWGRLVSVYRDEVGTKLADFDIRFREVLIKTRGGPMDALGRPGWFSPASASAAKGADIVNYLSGGKPPDWPTPEAACPAEPSGDRQDELREWMQWRWIEKWEEAVEKEPLQGWIKGLTFEVPSAPEKHTSEAPMLSMLAEELAFVVAQKNRRGT